MSVVVDAGGGGCGGVHYPVLCTPATIMLYIHYQPLSTNYQAPFAQQY